MQRRKLVPGIVKQNCDQKHFSRISCLWWIMILQYLFSLTILCTCCIVVQRTAWL